MLACKNSNIYPDSIGAKNEVVNAQKKEEKKRKLLSIENQFKFFLLK